MTNLFEHIYLTIFLKNSTQNEEETKILVQNEREKETDTKRKKYCLTAINHINGLTFLIYFFNRLSKEVSMI